MMRRAYIWPRKAIAAAMIYADDDEDEMTQAR